MGSLNRPEQGAFAPLDVRSLTVAAINGVCAGISCSDDDWWASIKHLRWMLGQTPYSTEVDTEVILRGGLLAVHSESTMAVYPRTVEGALALAPIAHPVRKSGKLLAKCAVNPVGGFQGWANTLLTQAVSICAEVSGLLNRRGDVRAMWSYEGGLAFVASEDIVVVVAPLVRDPALKGEVAAA